VEVLRRAAGSEARGIVDAIFDAVAAHAGEVRPRDDITAVVVKKR